MSEIAWFMKSSRGKPFIVKQSETHIIILFQSLGRCGRKQNGIFRGKRHSPIEKYQKSAVYFNVQNSCFTQSPLLGVRTSGVLRVGFSKIPNARRVVERSCRRSRFIAFILFFCFPFFRAHKFIGSDKHVRFWRKTFKCRADRNLGAIYYASSTVSRAITYSLAAERGVGGQTA